MCENCRSTHDYAITHRKELEIPYDEQVRIKKKGDAAKYRLRDGMMVTVEVKELAWYTGEETSSPPVYLKPGMVGIVRNKNAPKPTYSPYSDDPNKRRTTFCIVDFTGEDGKQYRCAPNYDNIVILPKKGKVTK